MNRRIGQYELLERFATGGMAEVHFARLRGASGFSRLLAVKRLLPTYTGDPRIARMFLDEARLAAMLLHPNIVQVLDLGELDGEYFIAMELVDGPHLGALYAHGLRTARTLPLPLCAHVVARAAEGVHYAHDRTDPLTGRSLGVVHRDMSPHNIIVSRYGDVKVADFGIARASTHQVHTEHGVIKGKLGYLAPEQCLGQPVDRRTDVFALGIVLYELLTGRRMYHGRDDLAVMRRIVEQEPLPPSVLRPEVDPILGEIALRALRKEPAHRYQTAGELGDALLAWLEALGAGDMRSQLGYWVSSYTTAIWEPAEERAKRWRSEHGAARPPVTEGRAARGEGGAESAGLRTRRSLFARERGSFIGRRRELEKLSGRLERGARLLTLTGPAGVGKSRLARRLVRRVRKRYEQGGVWICELGAYDSVGGLCTGVARALNIDLAADGEPPEVLLGRALNERGRSLLVLDDCERLVGSVGAVLSGWLAEAPELQVLVTSQQRTGLTREEAVVVEPLPVPQGDDEVAGSPAVHLFVSRARAARGEYRLEPADVPVVAEIVRQLDGLPLAIELAAARMTVLGAREVLERLSRRFDLLRARDGIGGEATLRGALDWSWEGLDPDEQHALARCSVFRGGFSTAAAEAVIGEGDDRAIDLLQSLRDKSLVRVRQPDDGGGEPRLELLRSVAAYVGERLGRHERATAQETMIADLLPRCEGWATAAAGHGGTMAFLRLAREVENLAGIVDVAVARRPMTGELADIAARAAVAMEPVLAARGPAPVLLDTLDRALHAGSLCHDADRSHRIEALLARSRTLGASGRHGEARRDAEEALLAARAIADDAMRGRALVALAAAAAGQGRTREAIAGCEHALGVFRRHRDDRRAGQSLDLLARLHALVGEVDRAIDLHEAALAASRRAGDPRAVARALHHAGATSLERGDLEIARHRLELGLDAMHKLGARRSEGLVLGDLAALQLAGGDLEAAREAIEGGLAALRGVGDRVYEGRLLGLEADRLLLASRPGRAETPARDALQRALHGGERVVIIRAHLRLVHLYASLGRIADAEEHLDHARGWSGVASAPLGVEAALASAHIDAARAARLREAGHLAAAAAHLEQGHHTIREAERAGPAEPDGTARRIARALWEHSQEQCR